jgi:hypothetical protein
MLVMRVLMLWMQWMSLMAAVVHSDARTPTKATQAEMLGFDDEHVVPVQI